MIFHCRIAGINNADHNKRPTASYSVIIPETGSNQFIRYFMPQTISGRYFGTDGVVITLLEHLALTAA